MSNISFSDQLDIFDPSKWGWPVHIVGLGGIGAALLLPLVKLGVRDVHIWDNDFVEKHNVPAQLIYRVSDVGKQKVSAAAAFIESFGMDVTIHQHDRWVTPSTELEGVVMSGVDQMTSRRVIWESIKFNPQVPLYIDGRIGAEKVQVLTVDPVDIESIEAYEPWLFANENTAGLPCAARTIIHSPLQVATWMIAQLTLYARGELPRAMVFSNLRKMQYVIGVR